MRWAAKRWAATRWAAMRWLRWAATRWAVTSSSGSSDSSDWHIWFMNNNSNQSTSWAARGDWTDNSVTVHQLCPCDRLSEEHEAVRTASLNCYQLIRHSSWDAQCLKQSWVVSQLLESRLLSIWQHFVTWGHFRFLKGGRAWLLTAAVTSQLLLKVKDSYSSVIFWINSEISNSQIKTVLHPHIARWYRFRIKVQHSESQVNWNMFFLIFEDPIELKVSAEIGILLPFQMNYASS